jgi:hypothetical protein
VTDDFDRFLGNALGPDERPADRRFVARVQARILIEHRLSRERSALVAGLVKQLAALTGVAVAAWIVGSAPPVARSFSEFPAIGVALLLLGFALVVAIVSRTSSSAARTSFDS